jgi:hypothetical protein
VTWAAAVDRANKALAATFGVRCTYIAGQGRREITATPGDITSQAIQDGPRVAARQSCLWSIQASELLPLLAGELPRRGHRIEVANPATGPAQWVVEYVQADQVDGSAGWVLATYLTTDVSIAAKNAERMR